MVDVDASIILELDESGKTELSNDVVLELIKSAEASKYLSVDDYLVAGGNSGKVPNWIISEGEVVVCLDIEATGLNPWEDRVIVIGCWDLSETEDGIQSFYGLDEERVCRSAISWLNEKKPTVLVIYNGGYDERHLLTRAMYYQIPMPWYASCVHHDLMDILKKGAMSGVVSSQPSGGVEDWEKYFWDKYKPATIEECFDDLATGSVDMFMLRNRGCVEGEGQLYKLLMFTLGEPAYPERDLMPTIAMREEMEIFNKVSVKCPVCLQVQDFDLSIASKTCFVCGSIIQNPSPEEYLREFVRPLDEEAIKSQTTAGKAAAKKK